MSVQIREPASRLELVRKDCFLLSSSQPIWLQAVTFFVVRLERTRLVGCDACAFYRNSVPCLRAMARISSLLSFLGGMPGGLQVSRKNSEQSEGCAVWSLSGELLRDFDFLRSTFHGS